MENHLLGQLTPAKKKEKEKREKLAKCCGKETGGLKMLRRLICAGAALCAVSCCILLLGAGSAPRASELRSISVLPKGINGKQHPAAQFVQQTLKGLTHDADEKLKGLNLHHHMRSSGVSGKLRRAIPNRKAAIGGDPDGVGGGKYDRFDRGQTLADLQQSLSSPLFSANNKARTEPIVPVAERARIAQLENVKLPGPLANIPKDMLTAEKAQTTMLTDRLSIKGVHTGYAEDPEVYVPRTGGILMNVLGVNTGEAGAWQGEDHWDDEMVGTERALSPEIDDPWIGQAHELSGSIGAQPGHPQGFTVNKYWAPVFGARMNGDHDFRPTQLAQIEDAEVEDDNGIPELRLNAARRHSISRSSLRSASPPPSSSLLAHTTQASEEHAQEREEQRDIALRNQQTRNRTPYTQEDKAAAAAWLAAGSQGPVSAGGGLLNARSAAGAMEDGAVSDDEESDAIKTLRDAMTDSRQKQPGHREPVARKLRMTNG